jgi:C-terminal processing protease CtpA/Prc
MLPHQVGYWRLESFKTAKDWAALQSQLKEWAQQGAIGIILDVRDFEATNDFGGASQAASLFCPPGVTFFSVQGLQIPQQVYHSSSPERIFSKPAVILMNGRTIGAAEAFAAAMRTSCGAILIGRSSAGQAALFQETKLSSGRYLRLAVGRVALADGTQLYGKPVTPDIDIYINDDKEQEALQDEAAHGAAAPRVQELPSRGHLSESALVRDETPELDEALADQLHDNKTAIGGKEHSQLQDVALMRAMDVLRAIDLSQRPKPGN